MEGHKKEKKDKMTLEFSKVYSSKKCWVSRGMKEGITRK
jgi:hypothetical protein